MHSPPPPPPLQAFEVLKKAMAMASLKSFLLLEVKQKPPLAFLSFPTRTPNSFQPHPKFPTFPTISIITHLPTSSIFMPNGTQSCQILCALPRDNDRGQADDRVSPTLNEDEWGDEPKSGVTDPENPGTLSYNTSKANVGDEPDNRGAVSASCVDEWGEKTEPEDGLKNTKLSDPDRPTLDDDEWGKQPDGNGSAAISQAPIGVDTGSADRKLAELKQCLVDCFYGTEYGLRASSQTRAEIAELISQLEAENPTPAPTAEPSLLQGKWILVYTSFSELLPLIAAGTLPFVKLGKICQVIDTYAFTVENSASYIGPFGTFSFRALASFEVLSPKRIQVKFEEGIIPPPDITSTIDIPEKVEILGQKIDLSSLQGFLYPLQEATSRFAQVISGQPPIKVPIRRDGPQSWLLITYLDKDVRISRGDGGGLFVLIKEGSSLLNL